MARRQPDRATIAILAHADELGRESNTAGETPVFELRYLLFFVLDLCTLSTLTRAFVAVGKRVRSSLHWKMLLIAANSSISRKVRAKALFYLGSAACELSHDTGRDPVRCIQMAFLFFSKALKHDPDDCWARKCRAELYSGYGKANLNLGSLYTADDALSDAREALEFFQSISPRHHSFQRMADQCQQLVSDLGKNADPEAKPCPPRSS